MELGCLLDLSMPGLDSQLLLHLLYERLTSDRDRLGPALVSRRSVCECACNLTGYEVAIGAG
jgi:hypothetical protein